MTISGSLLSLICNDIWQTVNRVKRTKYNLSVTTMSADGSPLIDHQSLAEARIAPASINYGSNEPSKDNIFDSPKGKKNMDDYTSKEVLYDPENPNSFSCCEYVFLFFAWLIVIIIPIFWFFLFRTVRDYERAVIFRLGKISGGAKGPGVFLINPLTDAIRVLDLRMETCDLPPQGIIYCNYKYMYIIQYYP